jgi:hypothetical protein
MGQYRAILGPFASPFGDPLWRAFLEEDSHPDDMKEALRIRALRDETDNTGHDLEKQETSKSNDTHNDLMKKEASKLSDTHHDLQKQETSKPRDSVAFRFYSPELGARLRQLAEDAEELSGPITRKVYLFNPELAAKLRKLIEDEEAMAE